MQGDSNLKKQFDEVFGGFNFRKPKSNFVLDKKKRIKFDPLTNERIPKNERVSFKQFRKNPFGITPGNAINPFVPEVPDFLSGLNASPQQGFRPPYNPIANLLGGY